jgi:hypothetical protein
MGARDLHVDGLQTYLLHLTYDITVHKSCELTVEIDGSSEYLYENCVESQTWLLYTGSKQCVAGGDAFPNRVRWFRYLLIIIIVQYFEKVSKGDYKLHYYLRSKHEALLQKLRDVTAVVKWVFIFK